MVSIGSECVNESLIDSEKVILEECESVDRFEGFHVLAFLGHNIVDVSLLKDERMKHEKKPVHMQPKRLALNNEVIIENPKEKTSSEECKNP